MAQVEVKLPTWKQCSEKVISGAETNYLERFIYENELAGARESEEWRAHLADVLAEAIEDDRLDGR